MPVSTRLERPTPIIDALYANDARSTTAMSYFPQDVSMYFSELGFSSVMLGSPMIADVAAMGMLYGLSTTTRAGDTTYGFNSNAGRDTFNAALHPEIAYTIFDSGGADTLDYSGYAASQLIHLTQGAYLKRRRARWQCRDRAWNGDRKCDRRNRRRHIVGIAAANSLYGGGGNDVLIGVAGQRHADRRRRQRHFPRHRGRS